MKITTNGREILSGIFVAVILFCGAFNAVRYSVKPEWAEKYERDARNEKNRASDVQTGTESPPRVVGGLPSEGQKSSGAGEKQPKDKTEVWQLAFNAILTVFAALTFFVLLGTIPTNTQTTFTKDEVAMYEFGSHVFVMGLRIKYTDMFGDGHTTEQFCFMESTDMETGIPRAFIIPESSRIT